MSFHIQISSKDKSSLKRFSRFILRLKSSNLLVTRFSKQRLKKFLTVLKSPHINKSAQEQFEYRIYTNKLLVKSLQALKFFSVLKKVKNSSFPGIDFKIKGVFEKKKELKNLLCYMTPDSLNVDFFQTSITPNSSRIEKYVQILDSYGEYSARMLTQTSTI